MNIEILVTCCVGVLYSSLAIHYCIKGNYAMGLVFASYALSMVGLYYAGRG